jgi:hypothetical protein
MTQKGQHRILRAFHQGLSLIRRRACPPTFATVTTAVSERFFSCPPTSYPRRTHGSPKACTSSTELQASPSPQSGDCTLPHTQI